MLHAWTQRLAMLAALLGAGIGLQAAVPSKDVAPDLGVTIGLPLASDLLAAEDEGLAEVGTKPVRKHKYKGRRTASKSRAKAGKRKSGARKGHGRKGGGVRKSGYASKKKAQKKKKKFKSKARTKKGRARGGRGR